MSHRSLAWSCVASLTLCAFMALAALATRPLVAAPDEDALVAAIQQRYIDAANDRDGLVDRKIVFAGEVRPVSGASSSSIKVLLKGIEQSIPWSRIEAADLYVAYMDLRRMSVDDLWGIAAFANRNGLKKEAESALWDIIDKDASQKPDVDTYLGKIKGIAVPDGGFIAIQTGGKRLFITPDQKEAYEVAAKVDAAMERVANGRLSDSGLQELVKELQNYGADARKDAAKLLVEQADELRDSFKRANLNVGSAIKSLQKQIEDARKDALKLINDERNYQKGDEAAQKKVDELVGRVRLIWEKPSQAADLGDIGNSRLNRIRTLLRVASEIDSSVGASPESVDQLEAEFRGALDDKLYLWKHSPDEASRDEALPAMHAETAQDSEPTAKEREHLRILNDYRVMMGLNPLRVSPQLTRSARGHSEYMAQTGKFAHDIPGHPHGASPTQRAARQGYAGGGFENIARSGGDEGLTAEEAFWCWFTSAGHHRNMLNRRHRGMGVGADEKGTRWTQQFGPR